MVLRYAARRGDPGIDLAVPADRGRSSRWLGADGGCRLDRRSTAPGERPEPAAGRTALGVGPAVAPWQPRLDGRLGDALVPVRGDQVLLQLRFLGEDDVPGLGARFRVHGSPERGANGPTPRSSAARPPDRDPIARPLVRRGMGRALDRIFVSFA